MNLQDFLNEARDCGVFITPTRDRYFMAAYGSQLAELASRVTLTATIEVACVTLNGRTLTVPIADLAGVLKGPHEYAVTCKTMLRVDFEALGEFSGF